MSKIKTYRDELVESLDDSVRDEDINKALVKLLRKQPIAKNESMNDVILKKFVERHVDITALFEVWKIDQLDAMDRMEKEISYLAAQIKRYEKKVIEG